MKKIYFFILFVITTLVGFGQSNPRIPFIDDPLPKTPEVSSLFRYSPQSFGNTGKIDAAVPIYTISVDGVQLPISIGYQNDGLKVTDLPSRVGHGWALSGGGSISRQVRGLPDEVGFGMLNSTMRQKAKDYADNVMSSVDKNNYLGSVAIGLFDAEFDVFNFQIGSLSGTFFIDINGSVRVFSARDIKVVYDNNFNQFTITDEGGNVYTFSEKEQTIREAEGGYIWQISGTSSWHISTIQTYEGKTIAFTYVTESFLRREYFRTDKFRNTSSLGTVCASAGGILRYTSEVTQNPKQLASITFPMGKVTFVQGAIRQDVVDFSDPTATSSYPSKTLSSIELRDYQNTLLKTYELSHGYFGFTGNRRLKLQSVTEKSQGQTAQVYSFTYHNESSVFPNYWATNQVQVNNSYFSQDHWGYYNGKSNQTLIPTINMQTEVSPVLDASSRSNQADRRSSGTYAQYGMLQKMTLPTKGTISYEYEMNRVYYDGCGNVPTFMQQANTVGGNQNCDQAYYVGGMRVKKEVACPDGSNTNCLNRIVNYETVNGSTVTSGGQLYAIPEYLGNASFYLCTDSPSIAQKDSTDKGNSINIVPQDCPRFGGCVEYYCFSTTLSDHNLSSIGGGNIIEYPRVEVLDGLNAEVGKTISWYNLSDKQGTRLFPYPIIWVKTWESTLATQIVYRNFGSQFKPISKTENVYATDELNVNYYDVSPKVGVTLSNQSYQCQLYQVNDQFLGQPFHRLSQRTTTEYTHDGSGNFTDSLKTYQSFFHENLTKHVQLTRTVSDYPNILKEETFFSYPDDFVITTPSDNETAGVQDLQNRNRHVPLETYTKSYDYNGSYSGISSAQTLTHILRNGKAYPYELFRLKSPTVSFSPISYTQVNQKDGNYEREVQYQQFDNQGNMVQQMGKSQLIQSFVYSYPSQSRLTFEGKNITYNSLLNSNSLLTVYADENSIHNAGNGLRANFPNSLLQSIAHVPMVGVASMAQPNNLKGSFGYDPFMRLLSIKDPDGNLTDYFRYFYASTTPTCVTPAAPNITVTSSSLCNVTLSALGCSGTVNWSNSSTGNSITVSTNGSTTYSATCTVSGCTSTASNVVNIPTLPSGWSGTDIGSNTTACVQSSGGNLTMQSNGGLGGSSPDNFHYVYKSMSGDFTLIAKISSLTGDDGDRAGLMIRSDLGTQAPDFTLFQDGNTFVGTFHRLTQGTDNLFGSFKGAVLNATWLRIIKTGNNFEYSYRTSDTGAWLNDFSVVNGAYPQPVSVGSTYLLGFATWGNATQATFSNITINGQAF